MPMPDPRESGKYREDSAPTDALSHLLEMSFRTSRPTNTSTLWHSYQLVARTSRERGATFQEFVVALVFEHLKQCLPQTTQDEESLARLSGTIGGTLCSDPVSKEKLLVLQEQLLSSQS